MNCEAEKTDTFDRCMERSKSSDREAVERCKRVAGAAFEACQLTEKWRAMDGLRPREIVFVLERCVAKLKPGFPDPIPPSGRDPEDSVSQR